MKIKKYIIPLLLFPSLILLSYKNIAPGKPKPFFIYQDSTILGKWLSREDSNWKLEFKSDSICTWSYTGYNDENYNFHISNTSPQCGEEVYIGSGYKYLQLRNVNDSTDQICYLIDGITDSYLSITMVGAGKPIVLDKQ